MPAFLVVMVNNFAELLAGIFIIEKTFKVTKWWFKRAKGTQNDPQ
jgi:hypothetical protein